MPALIDISGQRFGRLVAISPAPRAKWNCRCDCGKMAVVAGYSLRQRKTRSCGCLTKEMTKNRSRTHGQSRTRLYNIWSLMRARCNRESHQDHALYGGRGIAVCAEWDDFSAFRDWARANGYNDDLSIDRVDNDGNYEPGNCRWATPLQQARNNRMARRLEFDGLSRSVSEIAALAHVSYHRLLRRTRRGMTAAEAIADIQASGGA